MIEDLHRKRGEIIKEISKLLDCICTPCGGTHHDRADTENKKSCKGCPILHDLQEKGKLLEKLQKEITFSKVDINNLTSLDFYYLNSIKEYTVPEIAEQFQITVYRLYKLIDK